MEFIMGTKNTQLFNKNPNLKKKNAKPMSKFPISRKELLLLAG
jgi:hypothetical protein